MVRQIYGPDDEHGGVLRELIFLSTNIKVDLASNGIAEVDLAVDHVGESGSA